MYSPTGPSVKIRSCPMVNDTKHDNIKKKIPFIRWW